MLRFSSEQKQTSKVYRLKFAFNKTRILLKYLSNKDRSMVHRRDMKGYCSIGPRYG